MAGFSKILTDFRYHNRTVKVLKNFIRKFIDKTGKLFFYYRKKDFDIPRDDVKKILFISLYFRGDVLFHTPVLKLLKLIFKNAEIDVWIKSRSKEILESNKDVNHIIVFDNVKTEQNIELKPGLNSKRLFLRKLKQNKYDVVIDYTGLFITALFTYLIKPVYSVGKYEQGFGFLYNKFFDTDFSKIGGNLISKYIGMIKDAFKIPENEWLSLLEQVPPSGIIYLNNNHIAQIESMLVYRGFDLTKPIITIHLTAGWDEKRWNLEKFGELIRILLNDFDYEVAIVGNENDKKEFDKIIQEIGRLVHLKDMEKTFFNLPITMNAALIKRSSLFIGSDSLPLHIAGAVNTQSIGLFGPTNPEFSNPLGKNHQVLYKVLYCSSPVNHQYCTRNAGRTCTTLDCMKLISVQDVVDLVKKIIKFNQLSYQKDT